MTASTTSATQLLWQQVARSLIPILQRKSRYLKAGPQIVDSHVPIRFPKEGAPTTPSGFVAEGGNIPVRDVTFGELALLPSTIQGIKVISKFTEELARQSVVSISDAIKNKLAKDIAYEYDAAFFSDGGNGTTTPRGLFNIAASGVQNISAVGAITNLDPFIDAETLALEADGELDDYKWVMKPREFQKLRKIKTTTTASNNEYLLRRDPAKAGAFTLHGYEVVVSKNVPDDVAPTPDTARIAFVDFSQIIVVRDIVADLQFLNELYAGTGEKGIKIQSRFDQGIKNAASLVTLTGITI